MIAVTVKFIHCQRDNNERIDKGKVIEMERSLEIPDETPVISVRGKVGDILVDMGFTEAFGSYSGYHHGIISIKIL